MTFYLKYRPQTIDDLDLASVRESLTKILSKEDIPHAFLFAGPKGTGKTSAARIVAKTLNCELRQKDNNQLEPCNSCPTCLSITKGENMDVLEIDAASHRGIDDIRVLRDAVKLSAFSSKKKVYIIDEAHMLTTEACNALLKVLEEPPKHVVFILATTNPEKLIDTIRSRTTVIQFTKATEEDIVRRLKKVAEGEGLKLDTNVLSLIAHSSDGAFRDGVKLFEQIVSEQQDLTIDSVSEFLYNKKSFDPNDFIDLLCKKDTKTTLLRIEHAITHGVPAKTIARSILDTLRGFLLKGVTGEKTECTLTTNELTELLEIFSKAYSQIPEAYLEQLPLEIAAIRYCEGSTVHSAFNIRKGESNLTEQPKKAESAPTEGNRKKNTSSSNKNSDTVLAEGVFPEDLWIKVLSEIRPKNAATEALLRACKPLTFDGKVLTVGVFYKFHKERLEAHPHRDILEEVLELFIGTPVRISCMLTEPPVKKIKEEITSTNEVVLTEAQGDDKILEIAKEIFSS